MNADSWQVGSILVDSDPYRQIHEALRQALAETLARVTSGMNIERLLAELVRERTGAVAPQLATPAAAQAAAIQTAAIQTAIVSRHLLTVREQEVLARIAAGDSNKQIARAFDLSLHTVKRHVANILAKLGVSSRAQAAAWMRAHH